MSVSCVVPARMGSSRFPGKPLAPILGRPMVLRTLERARIASCFDRIICASDSAEIVDLVEQAGYEALLTPEFPTGTDRVAYAAHTLDLPYVVNLQGDEPAFDSILLSQIAQTLLQYPQAWVTAATPLKNGDHDSRNCVKLQCESGWATVFTRDTPWGDGWFRHLGIYAYSQASLYEFSSQLPSSDETTQSLEQLRILGKRPIRVVMAADASPSVDMPCDIGIVEEYLRRTGVE